MTFGLVLGVLLSDLVKSLTLLRMLRSETQHYEELIERSFAPESFAALLSLLNASHRVCVSHSRQWQLSSRLYLPKM